MRLLPVVVMVGESAFCEGVSVCTLHEVARILGRRPVFGFGSGRGVAIQRTAAVQSMGQALQAGKWRGVMMDYDTLVEGRFAYNLAHDIEIADSEGLNITGAIKDREGAWCLYDKDRRPLKELPPNLTPIHLTGLGFYYGDIDASYRFHEGDNGYGEDENFFLDLGLKLNVVTDVEFRHVKPVPL